MGKKRRLKLTASGIAMLLVILLFAGFAVSLSIGVVLFDSGDSSDSGLLAGTIWMIIAFSALGLILPVMLFGHLIDIKINGKGAYRAEFKRSLSEEQKGRIAGYITASGLSFRYDDTGEKMFIVYEIPVYLKNGRLYGRPPYKTLRYYIDISEDKGFLRIEAYTVTDYNTQKTALYGVWGILLKRRVRKIVAELLDIADAPKDIKV